MGRGREEERLAGREGRREGGGEASPQLRSRPGNCAHVSALAALFIHCELPLMCALQNGLPKWVAKMGEVGEVRRGPARILRGLSGPPPTWRPGVTEGVCV